MYIECCGREQSTSFCGDCGRQLINAGSLQGLLSHIRKQLRQFQRRYEKVRAMSDANKSYVERYKNHCEKWESWAEALSAVIESQNENAPLTHHEE